MDQWWLGLPATAQGAIIAFVLLPYVGLVTGRIVPRWVAEQMAKASDTMAQTWKDLYNDSEGVRVRAVEAMERGADAMEDSAALVKAVVVPLREHAREDGT